MEELWRAEPAAPLLRLMTRTCDVRRRQRAGTVQVPSVRPQNDADTIANAAWRDRTTVARDDTNHDKTRADSAILDGKR